MLKFSIVTPSIFSFDECLWFLHRNYDEVLYQVDDSSVTRAIRIDGKPSLFKIEKTQPSRLTITVLVNQSNHSEAIIAQFVERWFDLSRDLGPFYSMLSQTPALSYMPNKFRGLRLMGVPDMLEAICWCIMGQQINLTFAYKMKRRLVEAYGTFIEYESQKYWMFPTAEVLSKLTIEELKPMQFSRQKATYLGEMGTHFLQRNLSQVRCQDLESSASRLAYLQSFKGIGPWTANYVLMKTFGDTTSIPWGDTGLMTGLQKHGLIKNRKDRAGMENIFKLFPGFESYLVLYLWRSLTKYNSEE